MLAARAATAMRNSPEMTGASPVGLRCRTLPAGVVITLAGELDATNAEDIETALRDATASGEPGRLVVLDMSALTFMDSRGLNVLLRLHAAVRRQGGALILAAVHDVPARVLQITGVWDAMVIVPNLEEATAALRQAGAR
ncbi:STAS domain-containing protein [[Actinomadura] parvosata]|uniref:STAS domain-containing protein n=1 Tax=[Actinomadura] parvosata TaxID=1955412 RepID=UPI00406D160F